jgi:hypothetical protein
MKDISQQVIDQALEKFNAKIVDGYIIVPVDDWRRLVNQIFTGGYNKDIIHLQYKENKDG